MQFLRQNTAVIVTVGPFYDKTDGVTIETALTITNERITLTADTDAGSAPTNILDNVTGATSGTSNDLNYITGNDAGMMQLELAAADVNRVGRMKLSITDAANHVPVFENFFVLPQAIFDWLTGVIVPLPANVTQLLGTAWLTPGTAGTPDVNVKLISADATAADNAEAFFDGTGYAGTNNVIPLVTTTTTATNLTNAATAGDLTAAMKASVNAEALDVINVDTYAEPGQEAPGATVSLAKKISYLYKGWRNKVTQTATAYNLFADDTTTVDQKATTSDDLTTYTKGEIASGP